MRSLRHVVPALALFVALAGMSFSASQPNPPEGFTTLFNGKDFTGWKVPVGDEGVHWKVIDGVMDHDGHTGGKGERSLWTDKPYKDFVLRVDWRLKTEPGFRWKVP